MRTRQQFAAVVAPTAQNQAEIAIAVLWFYKQTQEYDERTAGELAGDMHDDGLSKPNVSRLDLALKRSRYTVRGKRDRTFQLNLKWLSELDIKYSDLYGEPIVEAQGAVLPIEQTQKTRAYIEKLAHQINVSYESGLYDASAVLCRRLMESLLIEIYVSNNRQQEIQDGNGVFKGLEAIIDYAVHDRSITLPRGSGVQMKGIKLLGDTAAHDRTYITRQIDIDDVKAAYRRLIESLLHTSGIKT